MSDVINPDYYEQPFPCYLLAEQYSFIWGNVIKYVWRHKSKGGLADLRKAVWYVQRAKDSERSVRPCTRFEYGDDPVRNVFDARTLAQLKALSCAGAEQNFWLAVALEENANNIEQIINEIIDGETETTEDR